MGSVWTSAAETADAVKARQCKAEDNVAASLAAIKDINGSVNAFSYVASDRALERARAIDRDLEAGRSVGPLAGVPFAVKNLFDVAGVSTLAGSKINASHSPASKDARLITQLEQAGAVLVGALHMGEYAYDFTGENAHYGPSRNPHDLSRMTGGSSSGSGSAVAAGLVPVALGSDTNGSIRVPSSFCGLFGLKPTYGRLPRTGTFPFVASFDHLGPLARCTRDLALAYDAMQGRDLDDPACAERPVEPVCSVLGKGIDGLRIAIAGGYFQKGLTPEAQTALDQVARALGTTRTVELPDVASARSAAFVISAAEGGTLHLDRLRQTPYDFDPDTRDRLIAGALIPASLVIKAQKFRRHWRKQVAAIFQSVDILVAPATPTTAPSIGQKTFVLDDVELPLRPNIGVYTQPISFIGLPVVAAPIPLDPLPIAVQIIAPAWREDLALRVAAALEASGVARFKQPRLSGAM
jgi:aspartyl-tRNA(Asn)/glutamyl-tRNA(Gln) amidotransferase subunit A